jgi:LysR family transcriptional regulator, hydrogen peroxide-inducible genes activator
MELLQLRYFVAIAETRSFTEAARRIHVSQPALSYQIKRLENEIHARLFERTSRRVSLTSDGEVFLSLAQSVLTKADEALEVMEERLGVETGDVTFGTLPSVGAHVVPHILQTFRHNFPGVRVALREAATVTLERAVLDGELDFAIVQVPKATEALEVTPLLSEELLLLVPVSHPLADRASVSLIELADEDFIGLGGSFQLTQEVVDACRRVGFEPRISYETGALESVRSFVRHELGIGILPRLATEGYEREALRAIPLEEALTRDLNLIRGKHRYAAVATRALMVHVRTTILADFGSPESAETPPPAVGARRARRGATPN